MKTVYLIDTNIISEPLKPQPNSHVLALLERHQGMMAIPAITWHKLLYGCERLADSHRKERIRAYLREVVAPSLPVVPYDEHAAWIHADARRHLEETGKSLPFVDTQIAAIAKANNLVLVTRNINDFKVFPGLMLENWFLPEPPLEPTPTRNHPG